MHAANGVGLAAPRIGVDLRLTILGFDANRRYPDAPPVPANTPTRESKRLSLLS
jgi:peptide deformylase